MPATPVAVDVQQLPERLAGELAAWVRRHLRQDVYADSVLHAVGQVVVLASGHLTQSKSRLGGSEVASLFPRALRYVRCVTYFADESLCTYGENWPAEQRLPHGTLAVGWLEPSQPYRTGEVPPEFVKALHSLCRRPVRVTRGLHRCLFCPPPHHRWPGTTVAHPDGDYQVGHGEVHVTGLDGTRYAAPDMVIHYVTAHGYRPPNGFIAGVLEPERS